MSRILVIDDSAIIRELLQESLTAHGYEVLLAETADEGVKLLKQKTPDLIVSDIDLPDVSGIEFCKMLRAHTGTRFVPLIFITGSSADAQVKCFQAGGDDFVLKPFKPEELVERIRAVLRRTQGQLQQAAPPPPPAENRRPAEQETPQRTPGISAASSQPPAKAPGIAPQQPHSPGSPQTTSLHNILFHPRSLPPNAQFPSIIAVFLTLLTALTLIGGFSSPGAAVSPFGAAFISLLGWGVVVTAVVVTASICGCSIYWKEGANLVSLAGIPVLFKLAGGCAFSLITTLSPFFFSAGISLFFNSNSFALARVDCFEIWSAALLWLLLQNRCGGDKKTPGIVSACAWLVAIAILAALAYLKPA